MNTIELAPSFEESRNVLSIIVDGRPLREYFAGRLGGLPPRVSPFGWNSEADIAAAKKLLLEAPADFVDGRYAILVCNECGDVGCGAYSAHIERSGSVIRWSDLGFQNNHEAQVETELCSGIATFEFLWSEYEKLFRSLIERRLNR